MGLKRVTVDDILSWGPCPPYDRARIKQLFGRRKYMNALQILDLVQISIVDRFWGVLRPEMIDERILRLFACDCAERALRRAGREPDAWKAVEVSRRYARGEATDKELDAARDAARAAGDAARAAVYAARAAARSAEWAARAAGAAWAAEWAAIWAAEAAGAVAGAAVWKRERQWQVRHLKEMLRKAA